MASGIASTVYKGTAFEARAMALLKNNLSMSLTSVAGRGDGGVDLQGWWWLPSVKSQVQEVSKKGKKVFGVERRRVRVVAQCKAEKKKLGPHYVRELEGVVSRFMYEQLHTSDASTQTSNATPPSPIVAILLSESPFTKASTLRAMSSPMPFLLLHLPERAVTDETEASVLLGSAAANPALIGTTAYDPLDLGGRLEVRWERSTQLPDGLGRVGLWWNGRRLPNWTPPKP